MTSRPDLMSDYAIRAEGLSKQYDLSTQRHSRSLRDALTQSVTTPFKALWARGDKRPLSKETFWALKNVSFQITRGEIVGVIGRNGAGKSTLMKIMSRITEPSEGRVQVRGRVASLLEVGTGFHPELTGRENIFLNGAILGMTRAEVRQKFDEIVAFADVERFIDTPVKHYSSGMYMRLAFAIAAHLETDILLIDEVLAVGDAGFQQKCLAKMEDVAGHGRTVLFVSHNMAAVQSLCSRVIHLESGQIIGDGEPRTEINNYLSATTSNPSDVKNLKLGGGLTLVNASALPNPVESGSDLRLELELQASAPVQLVDAHFLVYALEGPRIGIVDLRPAGFPIAMKAGDNLRFEAVLRSIPLVDRQYRIALYIDAGVFAADADVAILTVSPGQKSSAYATQLPQARGWVEFSTECSARHYQKPSLVADD